MSDVELECGCGEDWQAELWSLITGVCGLLIQGWIEGAVGAFVDPEGSTYKDSRSISTA